MPDFRIMSLSMVKNEQDIIEPFIRHNASYLDYMVILDNASVDETRRIAFDCARELKTIIIGDSDEFAYKQPERMTRLLRQSQTAFLPDFVLLLDADEFISARDREAFVRALDTIPHGGAGLMPWRTFVHVPGENGRSGDDPPRSMRYRRAVEVPVFHKAVIRLDGTYRSELQIEAGNHAIRKMSGEPVPMVTLDDLPLLHFPLRSRSQVITKIVVGWMAHMARSSAAGQEGLGYHWRDAFDRIAASSAPLTDADLCEMSMRYAQERAEIDWSRDVVEEEPPSDYVRRYSTASFAEPIALIARSWERSLVAPVPLVHIEAPSCEAPVSAVAATLDAIVRRGNSLMDAAPFRYIAEKHRPSSVLCIGCGLGGHLAPFKHVGAEIVFGVDSVRANATGLENDQYAKLDLTAPLNLGRGFDCVVCVEPAEQLEAPHGQVLLDSIARHAKQIIILTCGAPGERGHGSTTHTTISYWLAQWADRGWTPNLADTLGMRSLATLPWFRRELVALCRGNSEGSVAVLSEIQQNLFASHDQSNGVDGSPFSKPGPTQPADFASGSPVSSNIYDLLGSPDYWNRFFANPDPWGYFSVYETTKRSNTLIVIPPGECERGLELACAEGHFTALLAERVGTLIASDISVVALERAARRCQGKANIAFQTLDFVCDPILGQFDLIVCSDVLYYLGTIERLYVVMRKLVEALTPGGLLVMTHANLVSDDPDQTGFDWPGHGFGAKTIGDVASHLGGLALERELRTPLYRVQRFRRVCSGMAERAPIVVELPLSIPLDRRLERGVVWDGAIRTRAAALRGETATTLPILCYHRIAENGPETLAPYRLHPRAFEQQVRWLRRHGYYSVSIAQWAQAMQLSAPLPGRPVLFTFDDGYRDFAELAWPILDRHGFSALVFIVTGKVGGSADWDADLGEPAPLMAWEEIARLARDGVDFGSHSMNHRKLDSLEVDEVIEEFTSSRAILEKTLKRPILATSYPWDAHNQEVRRCAADCGYSVAVTTRSAHARLTDDRLTLPRIQIFGDCSLRNFTDLVDAGVNQDAA